MKKTSLFKMIIVMVILITAITASACAQANRVPSNAVRALRDAGIQAFNDGTPISDFTLHKLDGSSFTLSQQKGKVIFLNFWATWCPPCRAEMPSMESLYQTLKDKEFDMIAVNLGESRNEVLSFMNQYALSFPAVLDTRQITGNLYGIQAIPTTYIIDKRGLIVGRVVGSIDWNTPKVIAAFEALIAEGGAVGGAVGDN